MTLLCQEWIGYQMEQGSCKFCEPHTGKVLIYKYHDAYRALEADLDWGGDEKYSQDPRCYRPGAGLERGDQGLRRGEAG